jgi:hypothetical protein
MRKGFFAIFSVLLVLVVSIGVLMPGCEGEGEGTYDLTITSTAGGNVTDPGEGTHTYDEGEDVSLVATPDAGYRFVEWTGDVGTIDDVEDATTTITMNDDYSITAHFALGVLITDVPDTNQPPTAFLPTTVPTNFCAPMAMVNIVYYWDDVMEHPNALNLTQNVTTNFAPETLAEYLGYFMDTNNTGSPDRVNNGGIPGTHNLDIGPGTMDFVRWDATHAFPINPPPPPPPALPAGKAGYDWLVGWNCDTDYNLTLNLYKNDIDNGLPMVVTFDYWNPVDKSIAVVDPETGETINVFDWGDYTPNSLPPHPPEYWTLYDTGHAVTGVGYILGWDPDGAGPIPSADWVIVHDNWATTPENVAIPWLNWMCLYNVSIG